MNIVIPSGNTSDFAIDIRDLHEVWIAGERRYDAQCLDFFPSNDGSIGAATIWFPRAKYDSMLCAENDLVEIKIKGIGVKWRGYIIDRRSNISDQIIYTAYCLMSKFKDMFFWEHEYNYTDEVTKQKKYQYTIRQIALDAYNLYLGWKTGNCDDDFLLTIDLESFPDVLAEETKIVGQPLHDGLQQVLSRYDYRYKMKVVHDSSASVLKAYLCGAGTPKQINRATQVDNPYTKQPSGIALVKSIDKTVSAANSLTNVYAEGDNRIVESAFVLTPNWNGVADDFTPPQGRNIKEYVTATEQANVINNWDKYTKEQVDLKSVDKFNTKIVNPNYRKKYERVCTHYAIPKINNSWYYNDDSETEAIYPTDPNERIRNVKIESECVQTYDGLAVDQFIVLKRYNDPNLIVKFDGFSVKDSKEVVFSEPLLDETSNKVANGIKGQFKAGTWNESSCTSQYDVTDSGIDFTTLIPTEWIGSNNGVWLILGQYMSCYEITARTATTLTVKGNLTGAGVAKEGSNPVTYEKGNQWIIWRSGSYPYMDMQADGVGATEGRYQIDSSGGTAINNKYAGMYLVLGDMDMSALGWKTAPKDLNYYRISHSSDKYVYVEGLPDLTGKPGDYQIISIPMKTKRPYEWVALNTGWKSGQKLAWYSGNLSNIKNQRIIPKENSDNKWRTEYCNYRLVKKTDNGKEDEYTVTYNNQAIDHVKQLDELTAWAANQILGATEYEESYNIKLVLIDWSIDIGDRVTDTQFATGSTITSIKYSLSDYTMDITAQSWS